MNEIENKNNDSFLLFKIVIIGNSNIGKTRILNSYALKDNDPAHTHRQTSL